MRIRKDRDFLSLFDEKTGRYFRTGVLRDGKDSGEDPFMASFPELLDVGIMGHCIHGASGLCVQAGVQCYQDGLHAKAPNMSLADFEAVARQCAGRTFQFALGGCGDPDQHESFEEILKVCRDCAIVPNYTTSGLGMNEQLAALTRTYCGAAAVSWYRSPYTLRAIRLLLDAGVRTNIHYVLSRSTLGEALSRLKEGSFPEGVNAVVFLLHKPVGLGTREEMLPPGDAQLEEFLDLVRTETFPFQVGFDSCTVPAFAANPGKIDPDSLDTCEGARWSAYVTPDLFLLPCSFDNQERRWAVNLREHSIREAWESGTFEDFRRHFRCACPDCGVRALCMGGCPICPGIVLCRKKTAS